MRSASRGAVVAAGVTVALGLTGCVSTQTKNARTLLVDQRTLDSETAVRVTRSDPSIAVTGVQLIRAGATGAVVVRLRNRSDRPLSDLPVSVGVRTAHGRARFLNDAANLGYWATHVASIPAGASAVWVFAADRPIPAHERAFAAVGYAARPASTRARALPRIQVTAAGAVKVRVSNPSGVPQLDLPVYAVAVRNGRVVAAGQTSVASLDGGASMTIPLHLLGAAGAAQIQLSAPATIFS